MASFIHQECDVFDVVILVTRDDIIYHAAELLFDVIHAELELPHHEEALLVGVVSYHVKV